MNAMLRSALVVAFLGLTSCETGAPLGSPAVVVQARPGDQVDAGAPPPAPVSGDAPKVSVDAAPAVATTPEAGAAKPDVVEGPITCASLAAGGTPDRLESFQWQYVAPGHTPNNGPYDFVEIDGGCVLTYRHSIGSSTVNSDDKSVTLGAADCAAARGWATNTRFLHVLRTGENCPYGNGNPDDLFEVILSDEGRIARKTYLCPEPTVEGVRACLRPLVARLFPN